MFIPKGGIVNKTAQFGFVPRNRLKTQYETKRTLLIGKTLDKKLPIHTNTRT